MKIELGKMLEIKSIVKPAGEDLSAMCKCGHRAGYHLWVGKFALEDNHCATMDGCLQFEEMHVLERTRGRL